MRFVFALLIALAGPALADPAEIEAVTAVQTGDRWRFDVTVSHGDTGWNDYADAWRILDMSGNQIAIRELAHPHVEEQPFTRSLSGVRLPAGTQTVQVQARDLKTGWSPNKVIFNLP